MIHLVCAIHCEADPIIRQFHLEKLESSRTFPMFINSGAGISLTISGIGKLNASAATAFIHGKLDTIASDGWLNIGTAGHRSMELGNAVLANRIKDDATEQVWYPQIVFPPPCPMHKLITLEKPSFDYQDDMYDMEATGFYATAVKFTTSELIQCLKIISDNADHPANKPDKNLCENLVNRNLDIISQVIVQLQLLSKEMYNLTKVPAFYDEFITHWHFTTYERNRLEGLLTRWSLLKPAENPLACCKNIKNSREIMSLLQDNLDNTPVNLSGRKEKHV